MDGHAHADALTYGYGCGHGYARSHPRRAHPLSHSQTPDELPLVPPLNPSRLRSSSSPLATREQQQQQQQLQLHLHLQHSDLRTPAAPRLLHRESKLSDLFEDLSTAHRELEGYLNRISIGPVVHPPRASSLAASSLAAYDLDADSQYDTYTIASSPSSSPVSVVSHSASTATCASSANIENSWLKTSPSPSPPLSPSPSPSPSPTPSASASSQPELGSDSESEPEPEPAEPESESPSPQKPRVSSYDEDMLTSMTVDAAAALILSSTQEDSRPSSPLHSHSLAPSSTTASPRPQPKSNGNTAANAQQQLLENLLLSTSKVGRVCLVSPRAGPFEGQFVALITNAAVHVPNNEHITLIDDSEHESARKLIHTLRTAVAEWGSESRPPDVWVMLKSMAMDSENRPDARKVQTWVQNLDEAREAKIMGMQVNKHRRAGGGGGRGGDGRKGRMETPPRPARPDSLVKPITGNRFYSYQGGHDDELELIDSPKEEEEEDYYPLAVMQQLFFRTSMNPTVEMASGTGEEYRFSQSILLNIKGDVHLADIEAAVSVLVSRHSMLRARFRLTSQGWAQVIAAESSRAYRFEHKYMNDDDDLLACIDEAQTSLNVFKGPVFAVKHIRNAKNEQLLYLVAHHLVVDLKSWQILLHDLDELLREGTLISEPSMPFIYWTDYQSYENSQRLFDPTLPFEIGPANLGYWGLEGQSNMYGDTVHVKFSLPQTAAASLRKRCNNVFRTESADIFLAALLHSFQQTFPDRNSPSVWKQEHGRDARNSDFNIEQTVGWFTSLSPISAPVSANSDMVHLIKTMKDTRKTAPSSSAAFFQSKFSTDSMPATSIPLEVMFSCLETLDQLQRDNGILEPTAAPDREVRSLASDIGPAIGRLALIEVSVGVDDHGARIEILYNANSKHQDRIASWIKKFESSILEIISRLSSMKPELTLSDVPLLETSYDRLSKLTEKRLIDIGINDVHNIETIYPVEPALQEVLIAQARDANCFHVSRTYELMSQDGSLADQGKLCAAWETLVATHSVLRSIFIDSLSEKGLFDQVVLKKISPAMLFIDSNDPKETLSSLPPMKVSPSQPRHRLSVSRSNKVTFLRFDCSQNLCDMIAIQNLVTQLRQLYMDKRLTIAEPLPPRKQRHIAALDAPRCVDIWKANLSGATPCIFPHLAIKDQGRLASRGISLDISRYQLSSFCSENELKITTVIQLAWAFVLRTYVGEDRVVFGYQQSGRDEVLMPDTPHYVGSLAAIIPCMVDFSPTCTVLDVLLNLERVCRDSKTTEIPTLAEIEHSLGIQDQRLFNTCITCQDVYDTILTDSDSLDNSGWEPVLLSNSVDGNCDLSLCVTLRDDRIQADVSYACLSPDQLHNVINTFQRALQIIINTPGQPLSQADLFTEHDFQQIMNPDWEPDQTDTKISACLHKLIWRQCRARPYATAIYAWDGELSYEQVEANVTKLATYLVNRGVGPGVLVPIVLEKSRWSPVIMLAVLQAGGCFVCLDAQDMAMVEAMIRQIEPQLVVVTEGAWKHVSQFIRSCVLINETFLSSLPPQITVFEKDPHPQQAACAFLAPGTQRPKGVFFTHESLCSILTEQGPALKIHSNSRVLQLSAYTVDVALVEILGTMLHGGCVCIPSALERVNDLEGTLARMDITWTYMTTVLSRKINPSTVPNLQTICFRTRTLDEDTFKPWLGNRDVLLAYGAPEVCPLAISVFSISQESDTNIIAPPMLGRFLILNPEDPKKLMPFGAVGELAIDSPIITPHKYVHGNPLVDPAVFDNNPHGHRKWRYLRTGHRVRYLDRGHLRFLDTMRDEVGANGSPALTAVLEKQIRECLGGDVDVAVEPITTNETINSLAAFLEFGDGEFVGPSELDKLSVQMRSKLAAAKWLAETSMAQKAKLGKAASPHCAPTIFIPIRRFPLSTSLKTNRRKLQKMASPFSYTELLDLANVPFSSQPYFTGIQSKPLPLTQTEESMRLIWAAVLHAMVADIRTTDSFFNAGGDRLLAMRMVLSCRQNGYNVSINDVLNGATLTEICQSLEIGEHQHHHPNQPTKPSKTRSSPKPSAIAHKLPEGADHGFVKLIVAPQLEIPWNDVLDVSEASSHQLHCLEPSLYGSRSDVRCLVINFNGALRHQRLQDACEALTRLHPTLRTAFVVHDCNLFQVAIDSFRADFDYKSVAASSLDKEAHHAVKRYQKEALQLRKPATKFTFLDAGQQGGSLIIRFSYAQVSESSLPRLVQDFVKLYEHPATELKRTTFFDYTRALRGARYDDSMFYWKKRLEKAKMTQIVPQSKPLPPASEVKTMKEHVRISPLNEFSITFDSVLKAAWATVLATLSGKPDVVFGEVVEGRRLKLETSVDVSSIAGPMENIVPIRVRFPIVNSSPLQVLQLIQRDSATSLPYEAMGAQKIVHECTNWANWSRFSTAVRHRSQVPVDGTTTLNIDNTTFTYDLVQPQVRDVPDLFAHSTMIAPDKVCLTIEYSPDRVPEQFAETAMGLLVASVETLACYDTISQPILQPSSDYEALQPRMLHEQPEPDASEPSCAKWLSAEQRDNLQQFLISTWNEILHPATRGLSEPELLSSCFYDISGSILPAYLFAERFNTDLRKVEIEGIHTVRVTAVELISTPTITGQMALITRKMEAAGVLYKPGRKKPVVGSFHAGFPPSKNGGNASSNWTLLSKTKGLRRFRHGNNNSSHGSMRDFSNKAGDWMKSCVNLSKEKSPVIAEGNVREDPGWEVIGRDGIGMKESRGIETVPEAAVEIGTSAVVVVHHHHRHGPEGDISPLSGEEPPKDDWKDESRDRSNSISPRSWMGGNA
ncbi:hypothetical protein QQS21_006278 [Conoideocrella luteorostrata]|uniref:Carrier domain-containing protein n=1 Tax=Conoideocrella luteorostrata TaxID=1105319 RepID=A0AAJ0CMX4_9HYPO|nr:hypothetical protein QQS21_006278 [Conoideocrella luteorostrata]